MKPSRIQQALRILNSSAKEFQIEEKPKARKSAAQKKSKPAVKKSSK
jgi:hypothetical protein